LAGAGMYNEIRHVLFLVPTLFLLAACGWRRFPRFGVVLLAGTLALNALDHARLFPYAYTWLNEVARVTDVDRNFESDYWMTSAKEVALVVAESRSPPASCLYSRYSKGQHAIYLHDRPDICVRQGIFFLPPEPGERPLLTHVAARDAGYGEASGCEEVLAVRRRLAFAPRPMTLSVLQWCR
jgi:hypothetical protein